MSKIMVPVGCSNRHAHLTREVIWQLFGTGHELTFFRNIRQLDEFVSSEKIGVRGPSGTLEGVRVMGPVRETAQVEMSVSDARKIGVASNIRMSGNTAGTSGIRLIGPAGVTVLKEGVIMPARHIHAGPIEAEALGLSEGQVVSVRTAGARSVIFQNVTVRIDPLFVLELHLDTDEFNAAGLVKGDYAELLV